MSFDYLVQETKELINTKKAPGFIVGLSGIDSVLSFLIVAEAFKQLGAPNRVVGIHYAINDRLGWFESQVIPWLHRKCPEAKIVITELQYQDDYIRWGHLMSQSVIQNCWAVGSLNATEEYLGTYSNAMFMVSYLPLVGLYKTQIRELCKELQVPDVALVRSMMPDCECGRDQIESGFPEITDAVIKVEQGLLEPSSLDEFDQFWVEQIKEFVRKSHSETDFKNRIPYALSI